MNYKRYDIGSKTAIENAKRLASRTGGVLYSTHLLFALSEPENSVVSRFLRSRGISSYDLYKLFDIFPNSTSCELSKEIFDVFQKAEKWSQDYSLMINSNILFASLLSVPSEATRYLESKYIDVVGLYRYYEQTIKGDPAKMGDFIIEPKPQVTRESSHVRVIEREEYKDNYEDLYTEKSKDLKPLEGLGQDLTEKARASKLDPVIGRDKEIERVIQVLSRRSKNNPLLIGEPGVGKTAVVEGLASLIAENRVPNGLRGKTLFALDMAGLLSGTRYRGDFEERLKNALDFISKEGDIILFIDEIHTIVNAGSSEGGSLDVANILKPMLSRGELPVLGATTLDEYKKYIEKDPALERRFQPITIEPPSVDATIEILMGLRKKYEAFHGVSISDDCIRAAVVLSDRYIQDRFLPDKAIDVIDEACSRLRIRSNTASRITVRDVQEIINDRTGIPVTELTKGESDRLLELERELSQSVIGQKDAVECISQAIRRARAGLKDRDKPIGSFIFIGPTGVGKTQLAKTVAKCLFGDDGIIRFDMSEYSDKTSAMKLIGTAPGFVGYEEGGLLTDKVRRKPYSVILFDEIEKAHPDIFNLLLQIMDEGWLTDSHGRKVSFSNTVLIMTSNIGAEIAISKYMGFGNNSSIDSKQAQINELKRAMKPEFINRLDEIIVFNPLTKEDLSDICDLFLVDLAKRLLQKGISLKVSRSVKAYLVNKGLSLEYGARPLKRIVRQELEDKLSEELLKGSLREDSVLWVDLKNERLTFNIEGH